MTGQEKGHLNIDWLLNRGDHMGRFDWIKKTKAQVHSL